ncbi:hypothetical protein ACOMHN_006958 [Nucella lapillus]
MAESSGAERIRGHLRDVVRCLGPQLSRVGLEPSRVLPFMSMIARQQQTTAPFPVYYPLQRVMVGLLAHREAEGRGVVDDMAGLITRLNHQRVLSPENMAATQDVLLSSGAVAAMEKLLVCLYTTRVDLLKHEFLNNNNNNNHTQSQPSPTHPLQQEDADTTEEQEDEDIWIRWLQILVRGFEESFRGGDEEDSDDNDTVVPENNNNVNDDDDVEEDADDSTVTREPARNPRRRESERATRRKRTEEFVFGSEAVDIPLIAKLIHHRSEELDILQVFRLREEAQHDQQSEEDGSDMMDSDGLSMVRDTLSTVSEPLSLMSLENNSDVVDLSSRQQQQNKFTETFQPFQEDTNENSEITLRDYQREVISSARDGRNVVIILPTGTGKTFPVLKYAQEHLSGKDMSRTRRVVFLAPKVKLAYFQYLRFRRYFPQQTYFRCGRLRSSPAPFAELLHLYKVFVMTPMCLIEAVRGKELRLRDFSLIVLDECHHVALGRHAYRVLMDLYMDLKHQPQGAQYLQEKEEEGATASMLPQVIGLTASPDVGPAKTEAAAETHIREMCFAMDVDNISVPRIHQQQLQDCTNQPQHEMHTCPPRKKDGFKKTVERLMHHIEGKMLLYANAEQPGEKREELLKCLEAPINQRGLIRYCQWACNLENRLLDLVINNPQLTAALLSMAEMLVTYQRSLTLNEDCESQYAMEQLQRQFAKKEEETPAHAYLEKELLNHFRQNEAELHQMCEDPEDYNPKLRMLESILLQLLHKYKEKCACMVFVRTVELSKTTQRWVEDHPDLKQLRPGRVTGARRGKHEDRGMTRNEASEVLVKFNTGEHRIPYHCMTRNEASEVLIKFNNGEHRLVVCTSAAEEGLDFQSCNIVIRYDYVTSMISMVQTRGRARRKDSQYWVLGNVSQGNLKKETDNLALERLMNKALNSLQTHIDHNPNAYLQAMTQWQLQQLRARREADKMATLRRQRSEITGEVFRLLCRKCQTEACLSTDFRCLEECGNAVVGNAFGERWLRHELDMVEHYKRDLEKVARVACKCGRPWGSLNRYIPTGREFPLLKLENFILKSLSTGQLNKKKLKWSQAPFHSQDITDEELGRL